VGAAALLARVSALRRDACDLVRGDVALEVHDAFETLRVRRAERLDAGASGARLRRLEGVLERLAKARRAAEDLEDLATAIYFERDDAAAAALEADAARLATEVERAAFHLRATTCSPADAALVLLAPLERERSLAPDLLRIYAAHARAERLRLAAFAELHADPRRPGEARPTWWACAADDDPGALPAPPSGAYLLRVEGEDAVAHVLGEDGRHRHVPADAQGQERWALVRVVPLDGSTRAFEDARAQLHTVRFPGEKAPRGVPAALPPVARVYSERPPAPGIRDPRTERAVPGAGLADAARTIFRFALAWLEARAREEDA
jgi:hypothetical protein